MRTPTYSPCFRPSKLSQMTYWLTRRWQFIGASFFGYLFARSSGPIPTIQDSAISFKLWRVAAAFSFGFFFVNSTFAVTSVAMAETLRALEPVSTVCLGVFWLGENIGSMRLLTLVPIVLGAALASASSTDFNVHGLLLATMSNLCFSLRSVFVKDFKAATKAAPLGSPATFFMLVLRGIPIQVRIVMPCWCDDEALPSLHSSASASLQMT